MTLNLDEPVQTLGGRPVRLLCRDRKHSFYPIVGLVTGKDGGETMWSWTADGRDSVASEGENPFNLVNVPKRPAWRVSCDGISFVARKADDWGYIQALAREWSERGAVTITLLK